MQQVVGRKRYMLIAAIFFTALVALPTQMQSLDFMEQIV